MKTCLSIDWDFFVKYDDMLDLGFNETFFHIYELWAVREGMHDYKKLMPLGINPQEYLKKLLKKFDIKKAKMVVAESHCEIYEQLYIDGDCYNVINLDAHHDIMYHRNPSMQNLDISVICSNWVSHLINAGILNHYTHVFPLWKQFKDCLWTQQLKKFMNNEDYGITWDYIQSNHFLRYQNKYKVDVLFICRSGGWTPPCWDKEFVKFVKAFPKRPHIIKRNIENYHFDPMAIREIK